MKRFCFSFLLLLVHNLLQVQSIITEIHSCNEGCNHASIGNGVCDESCNVIECTFDGGDCVLNSAETMNSGPTLTKSQTRRKDQPRLVTDDGEDKNNYEAHNKHYTARVLKDIITPRPSKFWPFGPFPTPSPSSNSPTGAPKTKRPTPRPTNPTSIETDAPIPFNTRAPTIPTNVPTRFPTPYPIEETDAPVGSIETDAPTLPTKSPTAPTRFPTVPSSAAPTFPTRSPTTLTKSPTFPTTFTRSPSNPTRAPTVPTKSPTQEATPFPTDIPTEMPSREPTTATRFPTLPTNSPTSPTRTPSQPSKSPTFPSRAPTQPTNNPTLPTRAPTPPTRTPTQPTRSPITPSSTSGSPTRRPTTKSPTTSQTTRSPTTLIDQSKGYNIDIIHLSSMTTAVNDAFEHARTRWQSIITNDIPGTYLYKTGATCYGDVITKLTQDVVVDDLLIFADVRYIDGVNKILGSAGPCIATTSGGVYSRIGMMQFDSADMDAMAAEGILEAVILHEMGHVIGIGTLWDYLKLYSGTNPALYNGAGGIAGLKDVGGAGNPVVEEDGGEGTAFGHWDDATYDNELLTGYINSGDNPLSMITVKSLRDLGFTVDPSQADAYTVPTSDGRRLGGKRRMEKDVIAKEIHIDNENFFAMSEDGDYILPPTDVALLVALNKQNLFAYPRNTTEAPTGV